MSNLFITSALRDIVPTYNETLPKEVINYANYLYTSSKMTLPLTPNEEIGRYHLSCFVTIEHFVKDYNLPEPFQDKIPIPHKRQNILINQFRNLFNTVLTSTPRANRINNQNYLETPKTESSITKATESYADKIKLGIQMRVKRSLQDQLLNASNTNESTSLLDNSLTPPSTPQKKALKKTPKQASPATKTRTVQRTRTIVTTPILVTFCNKFYIPEHITKHILKTFKLYRNIVNNSWGLLVGLVGISYLQLNKMEINKRLVLRSKMIDRLHQLQQGGLSNTDVKTYLKEVTKLISNQKWIKEAKYEDDEFDSTILNEKYSNLQNDPLSSLCAFIDTSVEYVCVKDPERIEKWVKKMKRRMN